ncbi:hypothetical protein [Pinirhizobacter soli]|uniref:hypothetical protein n=1 Tax=Pinirhizobacter soli TaxID=2786953 RepID=UPI002029F04F|nr:hypothetical protein [Pinirhizobacter soli]
MTNQSFDDGEWQAQERARKAVRDGAMPSGDEGADVVYRRIAQALREPPSIGLPREFAADVAKLASPPASPVHAKADPELRIAGTLAGILVACCVVVGFRYAGALGSLLASPLGAWGLSALCCTAAAQGFQLLTKRMAGGFEASLR